MAELPAPDLHFDTGCPDCGERIATLPLPLPGVKDDFDWKTRDYDSFRLFLMQELAHRFPDRRRWAPADMEVVIIELLSAAFDRASHALDAVQSERFLATARRPQSLRRLLKLIGYDAAALVSDAELAELPPTAPDISETREQQLERLWKLKPKKLELARAEGPRLIAEQKRMVTLTDHEDVIAAHPVVARAQAKLIWSGAWNSILVSVLPEGELQLDEPILAAGTTLWQSIEQFHHQQSLPVPDEASQPTPRELLRILIERRRMIGSEVFLETAQPAPITFTLSVRAKAGYFRSELKQALAEVFSFDEGGFFEHGRLDFGEDLFASDIIEAAMAVEGVAVACLNRFKRVGSGWPDRVSEGFIPIEDDHYALCRNLRGHPEEGYFRLIVNGGEAG